MGISQFSLYLGSMLLEWQQVRGEGYTSIGASGMKGVKSVTANQWQGLYDSVDAHLSFDVIRRPYKILKGVSHVTIKVKERKTGGKAIAKAAVKELVPEAV